MKAVFVMRAVRACERRRRLIAIGAVAIMLVALLPAGASAVLGFTPHSDFSVGTNPCWISVGYFNGDGIPDLVTANYGSDNVSVLLGTGTGTFGAASNYSAGTGPASVAVGNFNADGIPDLAVANMGSDNLSVLLGNGDGTFGPKTDFPAGTGPATVAVGDFDGDHKLDLAVTNSGSDNVSVLLGDGDGTFTAASGSPISVGDSPHSVVVGYFNSDGAQDLVVGNRDSDNVSVLLGDGDGTFTPASGSPISVGSGPQQIAVGDFNGDGAPDLAVANASSNYVSILFNWGDGTFGTEETYASGSANGSAMVAVGDLNGDGIPDLALANTFTPGNVGVLLGNGGGSFGAASTFDVGAGTSVAVAIGDFNGDGRQDLADTNWNSPYVSILLNSPASADPSSTSLSFGSAGSPVPQGTVSAPQSVTVTNNGNAPLVVSGFATSGADPEDFFTGTTSCLAQVAPGSNCSVQVRFAPQAQGSRSATLTVLSNAPTSTTVALTGTAGPLPQGPAGTNGTTGAPGAKGPKGAPGKIQLVTCKIVTVKVKGKSVKRKKCTSKLVSGTVKFTTSSAVRRASLSRGGVLYATGIVTNKGLVLHALRPVKAGRYTLTLRYWQGKTRVTARSQIKIG